MQVPVEKIRVSIFIFSAWLGVASLSLAGDAPNDNQPPASPPADTKDFKNKGGDTAGKQPDKKEDAASSALDYLFNRKPKEGTAAGEMMEGNREAKGKYIAQDALGTERIEDPQMRARFEKYLGMGEVSQEQLKAYSDDMDKVLALLRENKSAEAWKQLYKLASYQNIDAGVSWELANRVESIWNADRTTVKIGRDNQDLKHDVEVANRNADTMSESLQRKEIEYQNRMKNATATSGGGKKGQPQNNGGVPTANEEGDTGGGGGSGGVAPSTISSQLLGKLQMTEEYLKSLEGRAKIKMNELKAQKLFDQAKNDFADYITTLFKSGRYRQVLVAADFWRRIFDQGEYPVSMAQQVNASLEIGRDTANSIDVFKHRLEDSEVVAASDQLQEAFMLSEFDPAVLGLKRESKKKVDVFLKRLDRMKNMIEARDFTGLETLLGEMKTIAPDFDTTKPQAIINSVKLESQLHLGKAKLAAQQGDNKTAMEEFQSAAEVWPGNPDLKDKALSFFNSQDVQTQSLTEFDRMVTENNYRGIFEKQLQFAPAMKDDKKRQDQLKDALEKVKKAETAIEKANLMRANGDVFGAWETVELAVKDLPSDIKLNTLRGELAGKGAEFIAAINHAKEAEGKQELGYSLTWYAIAQRYYPASQIANQAIDKLSKQLMDGKPSPAEVPSSTSKATP